jgi:hypothetical protein
LRGKEAINLGFFFREPNASEVGGGQSVSSLEQAELGKAVFDMCQRVLGVRWFLGASDYELPAPEQEYDDIGVVNPIDESGELFGFILDLL